nr:hypothetical protein [Moraxella osloensis]
MSASTPLLLSNILGLPKPVQFSQSAGAKIPQPHFSTLGVATCH